MYYIILSELFAYRIDMYGFVDMSLVSTTYPYVLIAELRYAEESVTTACRVTRRLEKNE